MSQPAARDPAVKPSPSDRLLQVWGSNPMILLAVRPLEGGRADPRLLFAVPLTCSGWGCSPEV